MTKIEPQEKSHGFQPPLPESEVDENMPFPRINKYIRESSDSSEDEVNSSSPREDILPRFSRDNFY